MFYFFQISLIQIKIFLKGDRLKKLDTKIESSTKTAVHTAIVAGHCCEDKEVLLNGENAVPTGAISMVFKPGNTTFGGHGEVFDRFCETGLVSGFPGEGEEVVTSSDANYKEATLKLMLFHETFKKFHNDVDKSMLFLKYSSSVHILFIIVIFIVLNLYCNEKSKLFR